MVTAAEDRPPYVTFEVRAEEDRNASIEAGHYVARDTDFAIITPIGSKDRIERPVAEWFAKLAGDVSEGRFKSEWLSAYRGIYKDWKEGNESPLSGTDIKNWPVVSPAQVKNLIELNVRTVEDLAVANEEVISNIGMGGRALKQKAADWLSSASTSGKTSEELASLRASNEDLKSRNASLESQLKALAAEVKALGTKKL